MYDLYLSHLNSMKLMVTCLLVHAMYRLNVSVMGTGSRLSSRYTKLVASPSIEVGRISIVRVDIYNGLD
jgi:hypothetical protein